MRIVFIGPSIVDDPHVHAIYRHRISAMGNPIVLDGEPDADTFKQIAEESACSPEASEYRIVSSEPIEAIEFSTEIFQENRQIPEDELLDGKWMGLRYYQDHILPPWRERIRTLKREDPRTIFFVDLGRSISCLYLAYFCAMDGMDVALAFHNPPDGEPFSVGGMSVFARFRGLLRRQLCGQAIKKATQVFVDHQNVAGALKNLFPKMTLELLPDPVSEFSFVDEDDFLSSGKTA